MDEQVLISGDGFFTIVYKKSVIFDPAKPDLKCGSEISYYWPEEAAYKRVYKGTVISISTDEKELRKLQKEMTQDAKKNNKRNKKRKISVDSNEHVTIEDESTPNSLLSKVNTAIRLNKELNIVLEQIKQVVVNGEQDKSGVSMTANISELASSLQIPVELHKSHPEQTIFGKPSTSNNLQFGTSLQLSLHESLLDQAISEKPTTSNNLLFGTSLQLPLHDSRPEQSTSEEALTAHISQLASSQQIPVELDESLPKQPVASSSKQNESRPKQPVAASSKQKVYPIGQSNSRILEENEDMTDENIEKKDDDFFVYTKENAGDNAVEILTGSNIYIEKNAFKTIKQTVQSQTSLARMLMITIFKEEALMKCSLMGGGSKETQLPSLPSSAVSYILKFCQLYASKKQWIKLTDTAIKDSLRSKLKEFKNKSKPKK